MRVPGMTRWVGRLPDFVVVGAPKAGTSSLHRYLSLHPEIHMATPKEPDYFNDSAHFGRWNRGLVWYRSQFRSSKALCGEASPTYAAWPARPQVAERMWVTIPDAKLIYLVREPLTRLRSHYLMMVRQGRFEGSFAAFTASPVSAAAQCASRYGTQLQHLLRFYPRERLLVAESTDLRERRGETLARVFRFLGVDDTFHSPEFEKVFNVAGEKAFPNAYGRRLLRSAPMRLLRWGLPRRPFRRLEKRVVRPFAGPPPSAVLSPDIEAALGSEYREEVALLRRLSGLPLPSLDQPVN